MIYSSPNIQVPIIHILYSSSLTSYHPPVFKANINKGMVVYNLQECAREREMLSMTLIIISLYTSCSFLVDCIIMKEEGYLVEPLEGAVFVLVERSVPPTISSTTG
jgi:hypothetical protein